MEELSFTEVVQANYEMNRGKRSLRQCVESAIMLFVPTFDALDSDQQDWMIKSAMDKLPMSFIETLPNFK